MFDKIFIGVSTFRNGKVDFIPKITNIPNIPATLQPRCFAFDQWLSTFLCWTCSFIVWTRFMFTTWWNYDLPSVASIGHARVYRELHIRQCSVAIRLKRVPYCILSQHKYLKSDQKLSRVKRTYLQEHLSRFFVKITIRSVIPIRSCALWYGFLYIIHQILLNETLYKNVTYT